MNIMISVSQCSINQIINGIKPYIFMTKKPLNLNASDRIFLYNSFSKSVVGSVKVDKFVDILPRIGPAPIFLRKFAELDGNKELLEAVDKINGFEIPHYKLYIPQKG